MVIKSVVNSIIIEVNLKIDFLVIVGSEGKYYFFCDVFYQVRFTYEIHYFFWYDFIIVKFIKDCLMGKSQ